MENGKNFSGEPPVLDENMSACSVRVEKSKTKSLDAVDKAVAALG